MVALLFGGLATYLARELFLFLAAIGLAVGLASLFFQGIAAPPVSVAIIVAALIVAAAISGTQ